MVAVCGCGCRSAQVAAELFRESRLDLAEHAYIEL